MTPSLVVLITSFLKKKPVGLLLLMSDVITDQIVWIEDQEKNSRQPLLFTWFHNFGQPGRHRQKWNLYL